MSEAGSPYWIVQDTFLDSGVTLFIQQNVTVLFDPKYSLIVYGYLISRGYPDQRVTFSSKLSMHKAGDWGYLSVLSQGRVNISYTDITFGSGIYIATSNSSRIVHSRIAENLKGIELESAPGNLLDYDTIENNKGTGIIVNGTSSNNRVLNSIIRNNGGWGMSLSYGTATN